MADHLVNLPSVWRYVNQFIHTKWAENPSTMRCAPDCTAMAEEFAFPGKFIPEEEMHNLYVKWAGPDVSSDLNGSTIEQVKARLKEVGVGFIDMQPLVDEYNRGNKDALRLELGAMNRQDVPQIITVSDEAFLFQAVPNPHFDAADPNSPSYIRGPRLHNWVDAADPNHTIYHHVIFRVGYSDSDGYGLYAEPAAPAFCVDGKGHFTPVKILWSDIEAAGVMHCLAIMPHAVSVPPSGFDYRNGTWPEPPKPALDYEAIEADLTAFKSQLDAERQASDARLAKILAELAAH